MNKEGWISFIAFLGIMYCFMFPDNTIYKLGEVSGFTTKMYEMGLFSTTNPSNNFFVVMAVLLLILAIAIFFVFIFTIWVMWDSGRPIKNNRKTG